eukprot:scaffold14269_cov31-Phaeocystis_antarctica.AAC.1
MPPFRSPPPASDLCRLLASTVPPAVITVESCALAAVTWSELGLGLGLGSGLGLRLGTQLGQGLGLELVLWPLTATSAALPLPLTLTLTLTLTPSLTLTSRHLLHRQLPFAQPSPRRASSEHWARP